MMKTTVMMTIVMTMKMIVVVAVAVSIVVAVAFEMTDVLLSIVDPGSEHVGHVIQTLLVSKDTRH